MNLRTVMMLMKRTISWMLIAALCLPVVGVQASSSYSIVESGTSWTLENDVLRTEIEFTDEGSIHMNSFFNKAAGREYLPQDAEANRSTLFRYDYRYLETGQTGKEPGGEMLTLDANDNGYELGNPSTENILMTASDDVVMTIGKRLEIPVTKNGVTVTLSFEIYDGSAGLRYQAAIRNESSDKRLQITSSDVIRLDFPDEPRNLHYACIMKWYSTTGSVDQNSCRSNSEDVKVAINLYDTGDGFYIGPEVNSKTQIYTRDPSEPDAGIPYMARSFAGIRVFQGKQVAVATNPEGLQLVLFPGEEFEYIAVNLTVFKGDIVDGKMAAEEHFRSRFKYNHTSTILNTNDWQWGNSKRTEAYYRNTAVPIAKAADFDMIMYDDGWNNGSNNDGTSRDGVDPVPPYPSDLKGLTDLYKNEGLMFGLWYSMSGGYHNRGNDLADPNVIAAKKEKIRDMINNYNLSHQMIDLTEFWLNDTVTKYSHPTDNVYRKNVMTKDVLNEIVDEYPDYKVKYTTEVDIWPSQGDRSNELLHVIDNGWTTSTTEYGESLDVHLFAGLFGHLPLNSIYFNNGNMSTGNMMTFYKYMFSRNVKHANAPDTWSQANIELMAKFNAWRKSERIKVLTDTIVRPVYAGTGWDSSVAANWNQNSGPYVLMHVSESKDQALMIATGGGKSGSATVDVNLRWLDSSKTYLIEDITLDDAGVVTYRFKGRLTGSELERFSIDLSENSSRGKAYWIEEYQGEDYQAMYADEKVDSYDLSMDGSQIVVRGTGSANSSGQVAVYGSVENAVMMVNLPFDGNGAGELVIDQFESSDDVFIPSLPSSSTFVAADLYDQGKTTAVGGTQTKVSSGTTANASPYGMNFTSNSAEAGSYIEMLIPVEKPGVYHVEAASKVSSTRGIGQWYIEGQRAGEVWNQNEAEKIKFHDLGIVTFAEPGEKKLRFEFQGGPNKVLNTDRIVLTPVLIEPVAAKEAEDAERIDTTEGTSYEVITDSGASGGKWVVGRMSGVGDQMSVTMSVYEPGTYQVVAAHKIHQDRGTAQLSINGVPIGVPFDQYGNVVSFKENHYGRYTFDVPGEYTFTFEVTGKHENAGKFDLSVDAIKLVPISRMIITGETSVEAGDQLILTAKVEGTAPLYATGDYVKWIIEDQQSANGEGKVASIVQDGLVCRVTGINPGTAVLKAMSTVSGDIVGTVMITVTGITSVPPQVTSVLIDGERLVGLPLTANITFTKGSHDANVDDFGYEWLRAGVPIENATGKSYVPTTDDLGPEIRLSVTPVDVNGLQGASEVSAPVFVTEAPNEALPQAKNLTITTPADQIRVGGTVTAAYEYFHTGGLPEKGTSIQWYTVDDNSLSGKTVIAGAAGLSITPTREMVGKYLLVEVMPRTAAQKGPVSAAVSAGSVRNVTVNPVPNPSPSPVPPSEPIPSPAPEASPSPVPQPSPGTDVKFPGYEDGEVLISSGGIGLNKKKGIAFISGYGDGTFRPDRAVTREEALTMLYSLVVNGDKGISNGAANPYRDVKPSAYSLIPILYFTNKDIVSGIGSGLFAPDKPMTRAEFALLISSFIPENKSAYKGEFGDIEGHWAEEAIRKLATSGLVVGFGDGTFRPNAELSRAQLVAIICRLLERTQTTVNSESSLPFTDASAGHWAYGYILEASR